MLNRAWGGALWEFLLFEDNGLSRSNCSKTCVAWDLPVGAALGSKPGAKLTLAWGGDPGVSCAASEAGHVPVQYGCPCCLSAGPFLGNSIWSQRIVLAPQRTAANQH